MSVPVLQDIHSEVIYRRIAVIDETSVTVAVHVQDRMFDRLVDQERSIESALVRLDALLQKATFCSRRPAWARGEDPEDTVIWIYLGRKVAMPCVLNEGVLCATTLYVKGKMEGPPEPERWRKKKRPSKVDFPRMKRSQNWLDFEEYDNE